MAEFYVETTMKVVCPKCRHLFEETQEVCVDIDPPEMDEP